MGVAHLFAGCAVADVAAARSFYERLFGRPADLIPHAGEACWQVGEGMWVFFVLDAARAGAAAHTLLVDDLEERVAAWATRGIASDRVEEYGSGARKTVVRDPDGNELGFAQAS